MNDDKDAQAHRAAIASTEADKEAYWEESPVAEKYTDSHQDDDPTRSNFVGGKEAWLLPVRAGDIVSQQRAMQLTPWSS